MSTRRRAREIALQVLYQLDLDPGDPKKVLALHWENFQPSEQAREFCARLVDEQHTGAPDAADEARLLLEVLTPIAKSWPSEFCLEANSLAIQIHGGYGYTRPYVVEKVKRDVRITTIYEGTSQLQIVAAVRGERPPMTTAQEALEDLRVAEQYISLWRR
mgnify:CR=1 FL=1